MWAESKSIRSTVEFPFLKTQHVFVKIGQNKARRCRVMSWQTWASKRTDNALDSVSIASFKYQKQDFSKVVNFIDTESYSIHCLQVKVSYLSAALFATSFYGKNSGLVPIFEQVFLHLFKSISAKSIQHRQLQRKKLHFQAQTKVFESLPESSHFRRDSLTPWKIKCRTDLRTFYATIKKLKFTKYVVE